MDPNRLAPALAAARLAEADARALEAQARRAEMALLADYERDRADDARRVVVRLQREQAEAVRAWVAANCGGHGHGG
jgi:hypothetical protein